MINRRFLLGGGLIVALALPAGCAYVPGSGPPPAPATGANQAIIRVDSDGGNVPWAERIRMPDIAIYGDGTAVARAGNDGPVYQGVQRSVTGDEIAELFRLAQRAKLFENNHYQLVTYSDATVLEIRTTSVDGSFRTVLIGPSDDESGNPGRAIALAKTAAATGAETGPYRPTRLAAMVERWVDDRSDVRPWPLPVPLESLPGGPDWPCLVLEGKAVDALLDTVRGATYETRWQAGDQRIKLLFRPLLPDEPDCAAIR